jgi:hypothetical protein
MAATAAQLKIIGVSKDPDNNEVGAANANGSLLSTNTS